MTNAARTSASGMFQPRSATPKAQSAATAKYARSAATLRPMSIAIGTSVEPHERDADQADHHHRGTQEPQARTRQREHGDCERGENHRPDPRRRPAGRLREANL